MKQAKEILDFWFNEPINQHWFSSTPEIDRQISDLYEKTWEKAQAGEFQSWQQSAEGCLALCIVLDQFPLNMFRGTAKSFSTEQAAVRIAKWAIESNFDKKLSKDRLSFLFMPLMHSENLDDQDLAVSFFETAKLEGNIRFAKHHRELIREFGRFPHRNAILGRESTQEELDYLNSDKAFTG